LLGFLVFLVVFNSLALYVLQWFQARYTFLSFDHNYASRVWIDRIHLSKIKRKYLSAYGTVARLLTQSYVSVSTEAAGVLAGILPLDLEIQLRNCVSEIRHARGAEFQGEYIAREAFDSLSHAHQYLQIKAEDVWQDR
jgi:hypothetical protein